MLCRPSWHSLIRPHFITAEPKCEESTAEIEILKSKYSVGMNNENKSLKISKYIHASGVEACHWWAGRIQ